MEAEFSQQQRRKIHPNSLSNLRLFEAGQSGNPGGNYKRTPKISNCIDRLLALTVEEVESFVPANAAEAAALVQVKNAIAGKALVALPSMREIADRTEGKAKQTIEHTDVGEIERLIIRVQERILAHTGLELSREQAIEQLVSYKPELAGQFE